ncbi:hypothetical protein A5768_25870 [Mycolicibacterium fortuitum]|nr:hypothetical protein A5768_25870 [Mycolicibacterium fortuitum]
MSPCAKTCDEANIALSGRGKRTEAGSHPKPMLLATTNIPSARPPTHHNSSGHRRVAACSAAHNVRASLATRPRLSPVACAIERRTTSARDIAAGTTDDAPTPAGEAGALTGGGGAAADIGAGAGPPPAGEDINGGIMPPIPPMPPGGTCDTGCAVTGDAAAGIGAGAADAAGGTTGPAAGVGVIGATGPAPPDGAAGGGTNEPAPGVLFNNEPDAALNGLSNAAGDTGVAPPGLPSGDDGNDGNDGGLGAPPLRGDDGIDGEPMPPGNGL